MPTSRNHGLLIVLCGPSGVGKTEVAKVLAAGLHDPELPGLLGS